LSGHENTLNRPLASIGRTYPDASLWVEDFLPEINQGIAEAEHGETIKPVLHIRGVEA
jgi:hypothetical protein